MKTDNRLSLALDGWWALYEVALVEGYTVELPGWWFDMFDDLM